ncbi:MAG: hypothetical protein WDM87_10730 [Terracidiphilus sp.]
MPTGVSSIPASEHVPTGAAAINNGSGILGAGIVDLLSNLTGSYESLQISATKQLFPLASASEATMSGAMPLDSFEPDADGLSSPQDSGYFGAPFTSANNSLGAVGGGLKEEYGPHERRTCAMPLRSPAHGTLTTSTATTMS